MVRVSLGKLQTLNPPQPADHWVPTGAVLVHQLQPPAFLPVSALAQISNAHRHAVSIAALVHSGADDLFMSPLEVPRDWLEGNIVRALTDPARACVGAVMFLYAVKVVDRPPEYRHLFMANPAATRPLPEAVVQGLIAGNYLEPPDG